MKHFLRKQSGYWLALLLCVLSIHSRSQYLPFKGANVILITTDLADKEAYLAIAEVLTEQGIAYSGGKDFLLIRAQQKAFAGQKEVVFEGKLSVNSGLAKLTGRMSNLTQTSVNTVSHEVTATPIEYRKGSASLQKAGFLYMNELAKKLQPILHGVITYKFQQDALL